MARKKTETQTGSGTAFNNVFMILVNLAFLAYGIWSVSTNGLGVFNALVLFVSVASLVYDGYQTYNKRIAYM